MSDGLIWKLSTPEVGGRKNKTKNNVYFEFFKKGNDALGLPCYSETKGFHHALIKGRPIDQTADTAPFGKWLPNVVESPGIAGSPVGLEFCAQDRWMFGKLLCSLNAADPA